MVRMLFITLMLVGCPKKSDTKTIEELEKERLLQELIESEDILDDLPESDTGEL